MKIAVMGTGYVGLVTGVCLAAKGHEVTCLDVSRPIVDQINTGHSHIYEKGLEALLRDVLASGRFRAALLTPDALVGHELIMLAVGTPTVEGHIDLRQIEAASRFVGRHLRQTARFCTVIVKSTVVPGTTGGCVCRWLEEASGKKLGAFGLGMNPEFLREGEAVADFMEPDRIVLGCDGENTWRVLQELYRPWSCEKFRVNLRTAEMIKYCNNTILATQISLVNELANIAAALGDIDIYEVMAAVHADRRWSPTLAGGKPVRPGILAYLWPGCGFGGSCFPKDVQALLSVAQGKGVAAPLLSAVLEINDHQPRQVVAMLRRAGGGVQGKHVLVLGLAFKPDTDDVRESASRKIIEDLLADGAVITAHDPLAASNARKAWPELPIVYVKEWQSAVQGSHCIIIATACTEYAQLKSPANQMLLQGKVVFDARRMFQKNDFPRAKYLSIGYQASAPESNTEESSTNKDTNC
jgi:UDPglucose 6-dehydrogenase/GDP-mannose 6-dehydrogenase